MSACSAAVAHRTTDAAGHRARAVALSGVLASFLFGVSPLDAATYAGAAALLCIIIAMLATYLPSRSAAKLDPLVVLRDE